MPQSYWQQMLPGAKFLEVRLLVAKVSTSESSQEWKFPGAKVPSTIFIGIINVDMIMIVFVHTSAIHLTKPAKYDELLQHVEEQFGPNLLMECAISQGEVCSGIYYMCSICIRTCLCVCHPCRCHFSTFSIHFPKMFKTASLSTLLSWPCSLN